MGSYKSRHLVGTGTKEEPYAWNYAEDSADEAPIETSDLWLRGRNKDYKKPSYALRYEKPRGIIRFLPLKRRSTWLLMRDKEYGTTPFLYQGVHSMGKQKRPILVRDAWDWQKPCTKAGSACHEWVMWTQGRRYTHCSRCGARGPRGARPDQLPWCEPGKGVIGWKTMLSMKKQARHIARYTRRR